MPFSLPAAMLSTCAGLITLAFAHHFSVLVLGACLIGIGSAIFHPEASRVARLASGGRHGLAQSFFQVGGNTGQRSARCWPPSSSFRMASPSSAGSR